ncbi:MAG: hypothetical protein K5663_08410 [Clostridiales bacterium]|nr:hypothetical protein [Clostridiales bacterium]
MRYRIKVEALEGVSEEIREKLDERLTDGIECEGFALICEQGEREGCGFIHGMSVMRLADLLSSGSGTLQAATLAKALYDAKTIDKEFEMKERFLEGLKNFMDAKKPEHGEG